MDWKRSETWNGKETKINKSLNERILVNVQRMGKYRIQYKKICYKEYNK